HPEERPRDANEMLAEVRRARQGLSAAELDRQPGAAFGPGASPTIMLSRTAVVPSAASPAGAEMGHTGRRWHVPGTGTFRGRTWPVLLIALLLVVAAAALG